MPVLNEVLRLDVAASRNRGHLDDCCPAGTTPQSWRVADRELKSRISRPAGICTVRCSSIPVLIPREELEREPSVRGTVRVDVQDPARTANRLEEVPETNHDTRLLDEPVVSPIALLRKHYLGGV